MKIKFIIRGELPSLNDEINAAKTHWSIYAKHKKATTEAIAWVVKCQKFTTISRPIHLNVTYYAKNSKKDPDNLAFARKYILDGMVQGGLLHNDTWNHVLSLHDYFLIDKANPRIEVEILY